MALDNPTLQEPVTTADKVFYAILHAIVDGKIAAGSKISEPGLAKQYEISRSTLREALNRLEKCHLIERKANVGSRVVDCTIEGLLEIYVVREALEGMACREAAINMSDDEIARAFEEHSHIIQAICDRDGELAEILMRRHIAASRKNIEKKIALQNSATQ